MSNGTKRPAPRQPSAETRWYEASILALRAEEKKHDSEAALYEVQTDQAVWDFASHKSGRRARRTYDFIGEVQSSAVETAVDDLTDWAHESDEPITVRLCSPGGDVFDGLMLFDVIRGLSVPVTTIIYGFGASMGSILSQAGDTRAIAANAWFMVHEPSTITWGKAGDVKREADLLKRMHKQLCGILAERSTLTQKQIVERSTDKDWWMDANEAFEFGFFDEVIVP